MLGRTAVRSRYPCDGLAAGAGQQVGSPSRQAGSTPG